MRRSGWVCLSAVAVAASLGACSTSYESEAEAPVGGGDAAAAPDNATGTDASTATDAATDANEANAARCNPSSPFADKHPIAELNSTGAEYGIALSPDELTAYFGSDRGSAYRIYAATRTTRTASFLAPTLVTSIAAPNGGSVRDPSLTGDGLTIFFEHLASGGGGQIQLATRANQQAPFSGVTSVTTLSAQTLDGYPSVTPDGLELFYAHYTSATSEDLYVTTRPSTAAAFGPGVPLAELNTNDVESAPAISADGLTLHFTATTMDGSYRIHVTRRANRMAPFGNRASVSELAGPGTYEHATWVSPDGCAIYYISPGGIGSTDLWVATRPP